MRLQRIYSSKIYLTSSRKDRIHAAMNSKDAWNVEFVQQLEDYLDDDAKQLLHQAQNEIEMKESSKSGDSGSQVAQPDDEGSFSGGGGAPSGGSGFSGDVFTDFGDDELADIEMPDEGGESEVSEEPEAVESVTQEGKPITATSLIWTSEEDAASECEVIKGTLNAREDTKGVNRLQVKDSELWIYYNDESNLNDIMIEVISVLNSVGYTYLKFNRLARSNNAIVFDILINTNEPIKSKKQIEEEK